MIPIAVKRQLIAQNAFWVQVGYKQVQAVITSQNAKQLNGVVTDLIEGVKELEKD